jgi:hypothetical protein
MSRVEMQYSEPPGPANESERIQRDSRPRGPDRLQSLGAGSRPCLGDCHVDDFYRRRIARIAIVGLLPVILASEAASQPPTVHEQTLVVEGRVLWIDSGSQTLALAPDYATPVMIDLRRIRQTDYHGFRGNEYVRVVGFILRPSRRIQATALYLVSPWYPTDPQAP